MAKPKALIFDVFGSLVDWRRSVARDVSKLFGDGVDADRFARDWRALYDPSMAEIRQGNRGFVRLDDLHLQNLKQVMAKHGVGGLNEAEMDWLNRAWHRLDPWPDVVAGLELLRPSFLLAPCSNGHTALMVQLARYAGFPWDTVLGAEPAQDYKPKPVVYLTAADWLGLAPHEVMMVAAHNADLEAAREAGLMTAFFPRPEEYGVEEGRDLKASSDWSYVARDLLELAKVLTASP